MDYIEWLRRLNLKLPSLAQHRACLYLERHGYRFLVDFGTDNAREIASQHRMKCELAAVQLKRK